MRKVLITGVTGFAGSHLVEFLHSRGDCEIHGIYRWRSRMENIEHLTQLITLHECDLRDAMNTYDTIARIRPDWIFHLAAQSFVPTSWVACLWAGARYWPAPGQGHPRSCQGWTAG